MRKSKKSGEENPPPTITAKTLEVAKMIKARDAVDTERLFRQPPPAQPRYSGPGPEDEEMYDYRMALKGSYSRFLPSNISRRRKLQESELEDCRESEEFETEEE
jgi:hypothetical protein